MSKVLVLDDDVIRLEAFKKNLIGHTVTCVMTAEDAISELKKDGWDYVFLDHDLGGQIYVPSGPGTGYEVAQWIHNNPEKKPKNVIIHSFNEPGRKNMYSLIPDAVICPGAWNKINN
jgi:CheY-like chemotaxis protein